VCNVSCADLAQAAIRIQIERRVLIEKDKLRKLKLLCMRYSGYKLKIMLKSKDLNKTHINASANIKKTSPILFTTTAFKPPLFAELRVCQKEINKYDVNPTPSHPKKN
jgi:hypothetical protein